MESALPLSIRLGNAIGICIILHPKDTLLHARAPHSSRRTHHPAPQPPLLQLRHRPSGLPSSSLYCCKLCLHCAACEGSWLLLCLQTAANNLFTMSRPPHHCAALPATFIEIKKSGSHYSFWAWGTIHTVTYFLLLAHHKRHLHLNCWR